MPARVVERIFHSLAALRLACGTEKAVEKVHIPVIARRIWKTNGVIILCGKAIFWVRRYHSVKETRCDPGPPKIHLSVKCVGLSLDLPQARKAGNTHDEKGDRD